MVIKSLPYVSLLLNFDGCITPRRGWLLKNLATKHNKVKLGSVLFFLLSKKLVTPMLYLSMSISLVYLKLAFITSLFTICLLLLWRTAKIVSDFVTFLIILKSIQHKIRKKSPHRQYKYSHFIV